MKLPIAKDPSSFVQAIYISLPAITDVPIPSATHPSEIVDIEKQVSDADV